MCHVHVRAAVKPQVRGGADGEIRTPNRPITSRVRCQLRHAGRPAGSVSRIRRDQGSRAGRGRGRAVERRTTNWARSRTVRGSEPSAGSSSSRPAVRPFSTMG